MTDMNNKNEPTTLLRRGLIGSVFAAICCFTPFLVLIVAGVGLSAIVGWLDYALFPMLFTSLSVVAYALWLEAGKLGRNPKSLSSSWPLFFRLCCSGWSSALLCGSRLPPLWRWRDMRSGSENQAVQQ